MTQKCHVRLRAKSFQVVFDSAILRMVACQAPVSTGFSRQDYCSRSPFPPPEQEYSRRFGVTNTQYYI